MTFQITSIEGNRQRLDGGAMFGNAPKALWSRWITPDEHNRIELACRAFLIRDQVRQRLILLEAGVGVFFEPKLRDRFGVYDEEHRLLKNLAQHGVTPDQIDVVMVSHLHFDHVGGLLSPWSAERSLELVFPKATFLVGKRAWQRATKPHLRDRASFISELHALLEASGRLQFIDDTACASRDEGPLDYLGSEFSFIVSDGHTPGLLMTRLQTEKGQAVFCGDLIPGCAWIHAPITMGYDRFPEQVIDEKTALLPEWEKQRTLLLLTHDPHIAACRIGIDDKRVVATEKQTELVNHCL